MLVLILKFEKYFIRYSYKIKVFNLDDSKKTMFFAIFKILKYCFPLAIRSPIIFSYLIKKNAGNFLNLRKCS